MGKFTGGEFKGAEFTGALPGRLASLTPREREVLMHIAGGETNQRIAASLYISEHTVKNHVTSIYRKLGLSDRTQIAILALRHGIGPKDA